MQSYAYFTVQPFKKSGFNTSDLMDSYISFTLKLESRQIFCSIRWFRSSTYGKKMFLKWQEPFSFSSFWSRNFIRNVSRDRRIDQSLTSIQSLLNTNGVTFLMTSHVRSALRTLFTWFQENHITICTWPNWHIGANILLRFQFEGKNNVRISQVRHVKKVVSL